MGDTSDLAVEAEAGLLDFFDVEAWQRAPEQPVVNQLARSRAEPIEVWFRNPHNCRPAVEVNPFPRWVFYAQDLPRRKVKPLWLLQRLLPKDYEFQFMIVHADHATITCSTDPESSRRVPVWKYGDDPANLLRLCKAYEAHPEWDRIVVGILKRNVPIKVAERQRLNEWLHRVGGAFPNVRLHLTGSASFNMAFGLNFASADLDPSLGVQMGMIRLPNGRNVSAMKSSQHLKWIHVLGYSGEILRTDHFSRVGFNMRAILWAAEHWNDTEALKPRHHRLRNDPLGLLPIAKGAHAAPRVQNATLRAHFRSEVVDPDAYPQFSPDPFEPYDYAEPVSNAPGIPIRPREKDNGDKIVCNSCSLANSCRFYREGSVCGLPDSPASELAAMFATRNADTIREALGKVLEAQTERYLRARTAYREDGESDVLDVKRSTHLMKMESSIVRSGEALVKILDPAFRNSGVPALVSSTTHYYNPKILVADVVKELENAGVSREMIDPSRIVDMAKERGLIE